MAATTHRRSSSGPRNEKPPGGRGSRGQQNDQRNEAVNSLGGTPRGSRVRGARSAGAGGGAGGAGTRSSSAGSTRPHGNSAGTRGNSTEPRATGARGRGAATMERPAAARETGETAQAGQGGFTMEIRRRRKSPRMGKVVLQPNPVFNADEIRDIRLRLRMSQMSFADLLGVSVKAVEAWEAGRNQPGGPALRLMDLYVNNPELIPYG